MCVLKRQVNRFAHRNESTEKSCIKGRAGASDTVNERLNKEAIVSAPRITIPTTLRTPTTTKMGNGDETWRGGATCQRSGFPSFYEAALAALSLARVTTPALHPWAASIWGSVGGPGCNLPHTRASLTRLSTAPLVSCSCRQGSPRRMHPMTNQTRARPPSCRTLNTDEP